jgi:hypothetical protein
MAAYPVTWVGVCEECHQPSPEVRDTIEQAEQDARECPCRSEETNARNVGEGF